MVAPQDACARLHEFLDQLPLYDADINLNLLPKSSGIYYFYEKTNSNWESSAHAGNSGGIPGTVYSN